MFEIEPEVEKKVEERFLETFVAALKEIAFEVALVEIEEFVGVEQDIAFVVLEEPADEIDLNVVLVVVVVEFVVVAVVFWIV